MTYYTTARNQAKTQNSGRDRLFLAGYLTLMSALSLFVTVDAASAFPTQDIQVSIIKAKAHSRFDPRIPFRKTHRADFYSRVVVQGKFLGNTQVKSNTDRPTFNQTFIHKVSRHSKFAGIGIDLYDSDSGSADDQADISPGRFGARLNLMYELNTGKIYHQDRQGSVSGPKTFIGRAGQTITMRGDGKNAAELTFRINRKL
ncbi:hypothetical protein IQ266_04440 [filamentous cyanobacterium LEGE 11480]|uniref:C2 domain-containing protein n=1 Tax=Romeriopsis navalis LEGE 11480 TaxID=2777977 RepID=A0A928VIL9_9CYAN|nr:C2 domain-containing protein [Romeriopsis navalis]MBE9029010.1 hypothetical protein [Romeriopsis navalis LEGE 11480]